MPCTAAAAARGYKWYATNTVVVMCGDHGFALGENGHIGKHHLYDVQVPRTATQTFGSVHPYIPTPGGRPRPSPASGRPVPDQSLAFSPATSLRRQMRTSLGLTIPDSIAHDDGRQPRKFVSLLDLYPTLARLAGLPLTREEVDRLEGTDLFDSGNNRTLSELELALAGSSLGAPRRFPQRTYPIVENSRGHVVTETCLVAEDVRFVTFGDGRGGHSEHNLFLLGQDQPTESENVADRFSDSTRVLQKFVVDTSMR